MLRAIHDDDGESESFDDDVADDDDAIDEPGVTFLNELPLRRFVFERLKSPLLLLLLLLLLFVDVLLSPFNTPIPVIFLSLSCSIVTSIKTLVFIETKKTKMR